MIFDAPNTKRNRIAAGIAIAAGLVVVFYLSMSDKKEAAVSDAPVKVDEAIGTRLNSAPAAPSTSGTVLPPATPTLPAGSVEDIDFNAYSAELANSIGLAQGETRLDAIDKIRLYFAPEPGTNLVNLTSSTFELDDGSVMLLQGTICLTTLSLQKKSTPSFPVLEG